MRVKSPIFRFAPSPNGYLHLGHALSALIDFEMARELGGRFLLRIEDIDAARCRPEFKQAIDEDLAWLGIGWEQPVRAMIASTITLDEVTFPRPGKQFSLIDLAVAPLERPPGAMEPARVTQLKLDLAVIMSAEALFTLTDLAGLAPPDAIASVVHTARTITEAAMQAPAAASAHLPT